jgi:hypothetical protein
MKDLTLYQNSALSEHVRKNSYFMVEKNNMPFLLALVAEEFYYTEVQLNTLVSDFLFLSKVDHWDIKLS